MTREREINDAVKTSIAETLMSTPNYEFSPRATDMLECAFTKGAEWADNNPVNPWHKASEELPEEKGYYFLWRDGDIRPITGWFDGWEFDNIPDVAYWMEIPEIKED